MTRMREDRDEELAREIRTHLELEAEERVAEGMSVEDAEHAALRAFGNVTRTREDVRAVWTRVWLEDMRQDVRYAVRTLARSRGFAGAAILTLALGIGANTAIYQLLDAIRLRTLPVKDPQHLAILELVDLTRWTGRRTTGYPVLTNSLWEQFRDHQDMFAGVLAWSNTDLRVDQNSGLRFARGLFVSGEFFNVLGVRPLLGRVFTAADDRPGCRVPGAVVSYGFWQRQLGGDPAAIGRTVALNAQQVEVIGVTPADFSGLEVGRSYDIAIPICSHEALGSEEGWLRSGTVWWLTVMGRTAPDRPLEIVNAQLEAASRGIFEATLPPNSPAEDVDDYLSLKLRAIPGSGGISALRNRYSDPLLILLVTTGFVLLIACTNLANLILARASAREREFAVRLALGASRGRLVRQLMVENGLLAIGGASAGLVLAGLLSRFLIRFLGAGLSLELPLDVRLLAFIVSVASLTCLAFGLMPAWRASGLAALDAIKVGGRSLSASRNALGLRRVLVVSQVALSLVLLFGALLFTGTLRNLLAVDAGFQPDGVEVARVDFSQMEIPQAGRVAFKRDVLDRIRSVPGVSSAAEVRHVPMGGTGSSINVWRDGADQTGKTTVRLNAMSEGYLQTMGIGLIAGRDFSVRDSRSSPNVAIVNRSFARRLGLAGNLVGERFRAEGSSSEPELVFEIIGLVPDTKYFTLREDFLPIVFVPIAQIDDPRPFTDFMIRSTAPLGDPSSPVRHAVAEISPRISTNIRALDSTIRDGLLRERLMATLSGFFGALAALIAAVGLYGVMSSLVVRRTNEIGVRMALGARRSDILAMVLRQAGTLLVVGLVVGSVLALATAGFAQSFVFGLQPHDLRPVGLACAMLAAVAMAASYLPARRAARLEPLAALRDE